MEEKKTDMEERKTDKSSPEEKANILSLVLFWWLNPILKLGNKKDLQDNDLFALAQKDSSQYLADQLEKYWKLELEKQKRGEHPSLRRALLKTFGFRCIVWVIIAVFVEALRVVQPILLGGLIQFFSPSSKMELWEGYLYAMGVSLCSVITATVFHVYTLTMARNGMWMRIAICSLVYKKCLRLSGSALGQTSVGHVVNLMSNDAQKLDLSVLVGPYILIGPVQMIIVGVILWYKIYWAVLAGMAVLILTIPLSAGLGRKFGKLRNKVAAHTDERVRLTNEMLNAMRVVKMYCWENLFKGLIEMSRGHEMTSIRKASYAKAMSMASFFYVSKLIAYFTFLTYILLGKKLTAEVVFVTLSLYTPVRLVITYYIPIGAQWGAEALTTISRMQDFLLKEERSIKFLPAAENSTKKKKVPTATLR